MKLQSNEKGVLLIVSIIGLLGVVALLFNVVSVDMTGQATSALKISKAVLAKKTTTTEESSTDECVDTDGGQDYFIAGTASVRSTSETDYCLTEETEGYPPGYLYETYCSNNEVTHEIINCKEHDGLECTHTSSGDACRKQPIATTSGGGSTVNNGGSSTSSGSSGAWNNLG